MITYTMRELAELTGHTEVNIRRYFKKYTDEFAPILPEGGRGKKQHYSEEVLKLLQTKLKQGNEKQAVDDITTYNVLVVELQKKIELLEHQIDIKDEQIQGYKEENGHLLLLLSETQKQNTKLLEVPKEQNKESFFKRLFNR